MKNTHTFLRTAVVFAGALASSNCMLLSGRCIYETRSLEAVGQAVAGGVEIADAQIIYGERRESDPDKNIYYVVNSPSLKGHVVRASLRKPGSSIVMLELSLAAPQRSAAVEGGASEMQGADLDGFWSSLSSEESFIELITDQSSAITIPLRLARRDDWSRPYCS